MKILMVDPAGFTLPYDLSLVQGLRAVGADVKLLTPAGVADIWQDPDASPIVSKSALGRLRQILEKRVSYLQVLQTLCRVTEVWKPDVVHFQWLPLPVLEELVLRRNRRVAKLVFTMHNVASSHEPRDGLRSLRRRTVYTLFDRIIVHSNFSRNEALIQGITSPNRLSVVQHGALSHYRNLTNPERPQASATVKLLFVGSIKPYKGLETLIESTAALGGLNAEVEWELCVAGKPSYDTAQIQRRAQELGVESRIRWILRHLTEREYAGLIASSDVVVLPYHQIDQSGVLLAAIGMGKPVVATRVGAFPELLGEDLHGYLVAPKDPVSLGMALKRIIADRRAREEFAARTKTLADRQLSWTTVAESTLRVYKEAVGA